MGGQVGPASRRSAASKTSAGPCFRPCTAANFDQRAYYRPDHIIQKTVGFDFDGDQVLLLPPAPLDGNIENRAHAAFAPRAGGFEAAEVVCADKRSGGAVHGLGVEPAAVKMPAIMCGEKRPAPARRGSDSGSACEPHDAWDENLRATSDTSCTAMSRGRTAFSARQQNLGRQPGFDAKTHHLPKGMNAGIGPPAGKDAHPLAGDASDGGFDGLLNRSLPGLGLPPEIIRAVVRYQEFESAHYFKPLAISYQQTSLRAAV